LVRDERQPDISTRNHVGPSPAAGNMKDQ